MENRILVKAFSRAYHVSFMTVSRAGKAPHQFDVSYEHVDELKQNGYLLVRDLNSFAEFHRDHTADTIHVHFVWLSGTDGSLTGREETVVLPYTSLMQFLEDGAHGLTHREWRGLSIQNEKRPQLLFYCPERLRQCLDNKLVRRKLVRFLRDNFAWPRSERICFYDDFVPYSFTFQEYHNGTPGIFGGLVLHGQENMEKAYYSIHT